MDYSVGTRYIDRVSVGGGWYKYFFVIHTIKETL